MCPTLAHIWLPDLDGYLGLGTWVHWFIHDSAPVGSTWLTLEHYQPRFWFIIHHWVKPFWLLGKVEVNIPL